MKIAVIIVEFNDAEETVKYVNKISKYEIINRIVVVDNLSTVSDNFEKLQEIKNDKIAVIQADKNGGYSYGNNFGIKYLEENNEIYDYLIISNPDIDIEENAIEECVHFLGKNDDVAIVAPRMYNSNNQPIRRSSWKIRTFWLDVIHSTRILEILFYSKLRNGEYSEKDYSANQMQVEAISGAFFVIKYDILKEVGMFDENVFLFYEEDILAQKLLQKNYKIYSLNNIKFIHYESQTIGKTLSYYKKIKQLYKSKIYYQKEYNNINMWQIVVFKILNIIRNIELIVEIPLKKFLKNIYKKFFK